MNNTNLAACLCLALGLLTGPSRGATPDPSRALSIEERIEAQRAIEQVYWSRRVWPQENPQPKPLLSAVMPDDMPRARVEDYLKKSNALEVFWQHAVTSAQLHAELDRMARDTKDGATLNALFGALGNDPQVIAETLARQTLVDRLIRSWYSSDARFHGGIRAQAEVAMARCTTLACMNAMGGEYIETTWQLRSDMKVQDGAIVLDSEDWNDRLAKLAALFGASTESIPVGRLSGLEETSDELVVTALRSRTDDELVTATVAWRKRPFETWWSESKQSVSTALEEAPQAFTLPSAPSTACTDATWTLTHFDVPDARQGSSSIWTGSEMIIWGGSEGYVALPTGARYNPATDTWTPTSTGANAPSGRDVHSTVWTGSEMIVWGGSSPNGNPVNTGGRYDPITDSWSSTATTGAPTGRYEHAAVWTGSEMIVWGGWKGLTQTYYNDGGRYNPVTNTWSPLSTVNVPAARSSPTAVWSGTEMIVWGGKSISAGYFNSGGRYNPATNTWATVSTGGSAPPARRYHTAIWTGTKMIIWGGENNDSPVGPGGIYDPASDSWTPMTLFGPFRWHHSAVWTGNVMIVWGGNAFSNTYTATGGLYDPATDQWTNIVTDGNTPSARGSHAAVWTGTEMIVWGGTPPYTNTGGRYDPGTYTWLPTRSSSSVPSPRALHSAVWTGSEMVVWGGGGTSGLTITGGRYQPATDTWTPTSLMDAPAGRTAHTTVWTGNEMIVWGGNGSGGALATGGSYSPTNDAWTAVSTANTPTARGYHTAVWTGTSMIVWGGRTNSATSNTGGAYRPSTFTWTPTSVAGVPTTRERHTAVWTGSEMIVWGGEAGTQLLNTGGRYNPSLNSWTVTSTAGALPSARSEHTAVWTGTQMIVWGGGARSGGIYDPSTNAWASMSTGANLPGGYVGHTAVWTAAGMIVWGGTDTNFTGFFNTGSRYSPATDQWSALSTAGNVPTARESHQVVWTGSQMIVWGGYPTNSVGGLYCQCPASSLYYRDADGDGFGDPRTTTTYCTGSNPVEFVSDNSDCDDSHSAIHPGAPEVCDALDNDCDGVVDNCTDHDACTQADGCVNGACVGSDPVICKPSNQCHLAGTCIPTFGSCTNPEASNGVACDDSNACTTGDMCVSGFCAGTAGTPPDTVVGVFASREGTAVNLNWSMTLGANRYDTLRGQIGDWPVGSVPALELCFDDGVETNVSDFDVPAENGGYWYLIRAQNACGSGGYGIAEVQGAPDAPRQSPTCP